MWPNPAPTTASRRDYGLLVPIATVPSDRAARAVRHLLHAHDVRTTSTIVGPGRQRILVFPEDLKYAYLVLCRHTEDQM